MTKYPIGIQDFEKIRKEDYLYVDKTTLIYRLVTEGAVYFSAVRAASVKVYWFLH